MQLNKKPPPIDYTRQNRVRLVKGGHEFFALLLKLIHEARYCIHLQFYIFSADETGKTVSEALKAAAARGVLVYLHVDGYASQGLRKAFTSDLKNAGVNFRWFDPLFKSMHFYFGRRLHHKVVVADGLYSLVAGINVSDRYNDMQDVPAWMDMALYCEGEASFVLHRICRQMWGSKIRVDKIPPHSIDDFCRTIPEQEQQAVRIRQNDWVKRKSEIWKSYLYMFLHAQEEIIIMCSYFLPGRFFRNQLSRAARRGVKIKVILAGPSDIMMAKHAERYLYDWLLKNNIEIYEFQKTVLHAKVAVYDNRWVTVGSYNLNNISAYASLELNMEVRNKPFAAMVEKDLRNTMLNDCKKITRENYTTSAHFFRRLWQRICYGIINNVLNLFTFYFRQE